MNVWIVTGGAATGKSAFCRTFKNSADDGAVYHFSCDRVARELWSCPKIVSEVSVVLGKRFDDARMRDGSVDLGVVRELVFAVPELRLKLEAIMHPAIFGSLDEEIRRAQKTGSTKVFLAEVPLYYEIRPSLPADTVIVVAASRTVQRNRLLEHRKLDAVTCEGLLNAQLPMEVKTQVADVVVWNDGSQAVLEAQAQALLRDRWEILTSSHV